MIKCDGKKKKKKKVKKGEVQDCTSNQKSRNHLGGKKKEGKQNTTLM